MSARPSHIRNVGGAIIGNTLEWFDILVYAYFVNEIAANFFPATSGTSSLLLAYGTFGLSFIARPLGAVVLGRIADRAGRRVALVAATGLMFIGTLAIGIMPTFAQIGVAAPALLLLARLIQGFSAGGEFGSATAYLAEQSPTHRAFFASLQFASQGLGMTLAAAIGLALSNWLSSEAMIDWGWRIPFLIGAAVGPIAYVIRRNIDETPEFLAVETTVTSRPTMRPGQMALRCALGVGAVLACTVTIYFLVYLPSFAQTILNAGPAIAYAGALVSGVTLFVAVPLAGLIADRIGALRLGVVAAMLLVLLAYPIFAAVVAMRDVWAILLGQFALSAVAALYLGALPVVLADLFDTESRSFGLAVSYNLAVMTAGGFAQMIFVLLIDWTGYAAAPIFYVISAAAISLGTLLLRAAIVGVDRPDAHR